MKISTEMQQKLQTTFTYLQCILQLSFLLTRFPFDEMIVWLRRMELVIAVTLESCDVSLSTFGGRFIRCSLSTIRRNERARLIFDNPNDDTLHMRLLRQIKTANK